MEGEYYCQRCLKKFPTKYKLKNILREKNYKLNGLDLNYETMLKDLDEKPNFNCKNVIKNLIMKTVLKLIDVQ